jgi:hypothetical protein
MPTSAQYARYRQDRTTIWVSKQAAAFLAREREHATESVGTVLDRLLTELRRGRRGSAPGGASATKSAAKSAGARKAGAKKAGASKSGAGARRARRSA